MNECINSILSSDQAGIIALAAVFPVFRNFFIFRNYIAVNQVLTVRKNPFWVSHEKKFINLPDVCTQEA